MSKELKGRNVDFAELIGEHELDAVDETTAKILTWSDTYEDAQMLAFRLDGKTYVACEDPDDGYRSSMQYLRESDAPMRNVFTPCRVLVRHRLKGEYSQVDDTLEFLDMKTGKVVLEVGTDNTDDYYPSFVASFRPENMASNEANK